MTITIYHELLQGTPEWYEHRRGIVTASTANSLLTATLKVADNDTSRGLICTLAAERITGQVFDTGETRDMQRGHDHEPIAREYYAQNRAPVEVVGFMKRELAGTVLGYSPDGLVGDDGLIEIKAPRPGTHLKTLLTGIIPAQYIVQMQAGLLVSGRKWCDYISFSPAMPMKPMRVVADKRYFDAITAAVESSETSITGLIADLEQASGELIPTEPIPEEQDIYF